MGVLVFVAVVVLVVLVPVFFPVLVLVLVGGGVGGGVVSLLVFPKNECAEVSIHACHKKSGERTRWSERSHR